MDELKELFVDGAIDFDTFQSRLTEKGYKLADLSKGGYVDKGKYDRLKGDYDTFRANNDVSKYADYEAVKNELQTLKDEKQNAIDEKIIADAGVSSQFVKFVLSECRAKVDDKTDLKKAVETYLSENPQYKPEQPSVRFSSGLNLNGQSASQGTNEKMNNLIRGIKK